MSATHDDHDAHGSVSGAHDAANDDEAHGGGHGADPNAGIVMGDPPTPAWVLTAAAIGLVTLVAAVVLAMALRDVESPGTTDGGSGGGATEQTEG
jgi:hypothetical protein